MMTGYEAAERIAKVLRANGVQDPPIGQVVGVGHPAKTPYGLGYLVENALRHMANKGGAVLIQAGSNPNPAIKYDDDIRADRQHGPAPELAAKPKKGGC